ncbi:MAG: lipocalin-like domain-containing protein, partial [Deltaproteobacteria bacterium]|nr:lipocalin-like domain-containing protein [Deltaproteobacteria bacterium]
MEKNHLVGIWRLASWENRSKDGQVTYPFGQDAVGYITYIEDGYMFVAIMTANRPLFTSEDILGGSTEEKAAAAETYISYCGTYEIQGEKVIHHIEVSSFPNWVGSAQKRIFELKEDKLLLSTLPLLLSGRQQ